MSVAVSIVSLFMTVLLLVVRHTMGRFTAALAREARIVALPARDGLIFPCIARVAAAAVVLALLTSPPAMLTASIPALPRNRVRSVPAA